MSNTNNKFWQSVDAIGLQIDEVDAATIATLAIEYGIPTNQALEAISSRWHGVGKKDLGVFVALSKFVSEYCEVSSACRILEFSSSPRLLTTTFLENNKSAIGKFLTEYEDLTNALEILFGKDSVIQTTDNTDFDEEFDSIVCQTEIGQRNKNRHSDGLGGEILISLATKFSTVERLLWMTSRNALYSKKSKKTFEELSNLGLNIAASIEIPVGGLYGTSIEGVLIIFQKKLPSRKFVGALLNDTPISRMATALYQGPTRKKGLSWEWIEFEDCRSYFDIERLKSIESLIPRGRFEWFELGHIVEENGIGRLDPSMTEDNETTGFIYVPEYVPSKVSNRIKEITVKPRSVYRIGIDTTKANPQFLEILLNSRYGREVRDAKARGLTIRRINRVGLETLRLPLPDLAIQNRIVQAEHELSNLLPNILELQESLSADWGDLPDIEQRVDEIKSVFDIDTKIENWWSELPYPLATIYRKYQYSKDPKEQFERLLHFFELFTIYIASIGASHVKALEHENKWQECFSKWFYPEKGNDIERADFGFWLQLAQNSLKEVRRISSNPENREQAIKQAHDLLYTTERIGKLSDTVTILDSVRTIRNEWKGHGGYINPALATRLVEDLQESIRKIYSTTATIFRQLLLIRPGSATVLDESYKYEYTELMGSDPTFRNESVELRGKTKSDALAFWMKGSKTACPALPFFRFSTPEDPQGSSFYVYNRIKKKGFRWISYQEAQEPHLIAPNDELQDLIVLAKSNESQ